MKTPDLRPSATRLRLVAVALALISIGCIPLFPIGGRPNSLIFLSKAEIQKINTSNLTKTSIIEKFGTPSMEISEPNAMGYLRVVTVEKWVMWLLIPPICIPEKWEKLSYYQVLMYWFDSEGKITKHEVWNGRESLMGSPKVKLKEWLLEGAPKSNSARPLNTPGKAAPDA